MLVMPINMKVRLAFSTCSLGEQLDIPISIINAGYFQFDLPSVDFVICKAPQIELETKWV